MANLSRWKRRIPKWEGNADDPSPFAIEVKRLSVDERAAFHARLVALTDGGTDTMGAALASVVRGPIGDLAFDGVPFTGGIAELVDALLLADPVAYRSLVAELIASVSEINGVDAGG